MGCYFLQHEEKSIVHLMISSTFSFVVRFNLIQNLYKIFYFVIQLHFVGIKPRITV